MTVGRPEDLPEVRHVLDSFESDLLRGVSPIDQALHDYTVGRVRDAMDDAGLDAGMNARVVESLGFFHRSPEARLRMTLARRSGIPYSEAMERWAAPDDLAAEVAWDAHKAALDLRRCPTCGTDPADVLDIENGNRPLPEGRLKLELWDCWMCGQIEQHRRPISDQDRARGVDVRIVPRQPGDPFYEPGLPAD